MLDTVEKVNEWLEDGGTIECADCPKDIKHGDNYVFISGYVFCMECVK